MAYRNTISECSHPGFFVSFLVKLNVAKKQLKSLSSHFISIILPDQSRLKAEKLIYL